jgi:hypothetical protein
MVTQCIFVNVVLLLPMLARRFDFADVRLASRMEPLNMSV